MYEKTLICEIECCANPLCVAFGSGTFICNFIMKLVCEGETLEICYRYIANSYLIMLMTLKKKLICSQY